MKVLVERIRPIQTPFGANLVIEGGGYRFIMGSIPEVTAQKIAMIQRVGGNPDVRLIIEEVLEKEQALDIGIEELYIDSVDDMGVYYSTLKTKNTEHIMIPSEGVLLATFTGSKIYFDTNLPTASPNIVE